MPIIDLYFRATADASGAGLTRWNALQNATTRTAFRWVPLPDSGF